MAWFTRLSPDGAHVAGQRTTDHAIDLDGEILDAPGIQPAWWTLRRLLWIVAGQPQLRWYDLETHERGTIPLAHEANELYANGSGAWLAGHRGHPLGYTHSHTGPFLPGHTGTFVPSDTMPVLLHDGTLAWLPADAIQGRSVPSGLLWIQRPGPPLVAPLDWAPWRPVTHIAIPVETPDGPWVVRLEDTRLVAHPKGQAEGVVVATVDTFYPDAIWSMSRDGIRVVSTSNQGETQDWTVPLGAPRISLRPVPPVIPPVPTPTPTPAPPRPVPPSPPKDPMTELQIPRNETLDMLEAVNAAYREAGRGVNQSLYIDNEGIAVWPCNEYARHRSRGVDHAAAKAAVLRDLRPALGLDPQ